MNENKSVAELAAETKAMLEDRFAEQNLRILDLEQHGARGGGSGIRNESWGAQVAFSDEVKAFAGLTNSQPGRIRLEMKEITSGLTSGGALYSPMRDPTINPIPGRAPRIRDLL